MRNPLFSKLLTDLRKIDTVATSLRIEQLFEHEPDRIQRMSVRLPGILLDISKQRLSKKAHQVLLEMLSKSGLLSERARMFEGEVINYTEQRPVLHVALRAQEGDAAAMPQLLAEVLAQRRRMLAFAEEIRSSNNISDVIHVGIGGSDLGPRVALQALSSGTPDGPRVHFLSSMDGHALANVLAIANPKRTLLSIASKSFSTLETRINAASLRLWMQEAGLSEQEIKTRCVALTANTQAALSEGILPEFIFPLWEWVGGRYSLCSSIGLPIALAFGSKVFEQMLAGARAMDQHFLNAPVDLNGPILLAMVDVWNLNVLDLRTHCIVPYHANLARLPAYLQQLEMESNGKARDVDGLPLPYQVAPLVWGEAGTDAQHSFFQWLHQGTQVCPVDFIAVKTASHSYAEHHSQLIANCLAQSAALMKGKSLQQAHAEMMAAGMSAAQADALAGHRAFEGNRPSSVLLLDKLDAWHFGALIALYEHKTFVASLLWGINAFDQWGVELGKNLAADMYLRIRGQAAPKFDPSTESLLQALK